ncbi:hypothetical protein BH10ACI1_BH10ACI1_12630 [soil metagenome]
MRIFNLNDAGFRYSGTDKWVFRHFDLQIEAGETIRIIGRNGSGKSTLLKILSGLLDLTEGTIEIEPDFKVAYMDQFSGDMLARDLTIAEQLKAITKSASAFSESVKTLAKFGLGLQERTNEFIGHLSGGQRQIVALLCILTGGANVLCLDEFTSSMDDYSIEIANQLLLVAQTNMEITLVLVGHGSFKNKIDREVKINEISEILHNDNLITEPLNQ